MSDAEDTDKAPPSRLGRRLLSVVERRMVRTDSDDAMTRASLGFLRRAESVMDRLDAVAQTMEKVAEVELKLAERLVPIVDDLGELVRHTLDEARQRRGLSPKAESEPVTVDVTPSDKD